MNARLSIKITRERKAAMAVIAGITQTQVTYTKAPRFAYEAGGCSIDREGVLSTAPLPIREADFHANVIGALGKEGFIAEGSLCITVYPDNTSDGLLQNVQAVLSGRATLIRHALDIDTEPFAQLTEESGIALPFFPARLSAAAILAAVQLAHGICDLAASQRRVRLKNTEVANEKYAMRCFLLRIGMIGSVYAVARRELLARLPGDASFKSGTRPAVSSAGDCLACAGSMSEPGGADGDRLFCVTRQEYVSEDGSCASFN